MKKRSPPGKFVFISWEVIIVLSGEFRSLWLEKDGDAQNLAKNDYYYYFFNTFYNDE